jgi:hypothetical protein
MQAVQHSAGQTQGDDVHCISWRAWGYGAGIPLFRKVVACWYSEMLSAVQSLARMGARVTGIDVAAASVAIAERHAQDDPWIASRVAYREASAEQLVDEGVGQGLESVGLVCSAAQCSTVLHGRPIFSACAAQPCGCGTIGGGRIRGIQPGAQSACKAWNLGTCWICKCGN